MVVNLLCNFCQKSKEILKKEIALGREGLLPTVTILSTPVMKVYLCPFIHLKEIGLEGHGYLLQNIWVSSAIKSFVTIATMVTNMKKNHYLCQYCLFLMGNRYKLYHLTNSCQYRLSSLNSTRCPCEDV